jgi:hypothetical protein
VALILEATRPADDFEQLLACRVRHDTAGKGERRGVFGVTTAITACDSIAMSLIPSTILIRRAWHFARC